MSNFVNRNFFLLTKLKNCKLRQKNCDYVIFIILFFTKYSYNAVEKANEIIKYLVKSFYSKYNTTQLINITPGT